MKTTYVLLFFGLLAFSACRPRPEMNNVEFFELNPTEFEQKSIDLTDEQLVDVRTPQEFAEGKLKDAINIDYNDAAFQQVSLAKLTINKPVMVYCFAGTRSKEAADFLRAKGYKVYELAGGIQKWKKENKPVETEQMTAEGSKESKDGVISLADFNKKISGDKPVLVDFSAVWCMPCKRMKPTIDKIATEMAAKVEVLMVDVDKSPEVTAAYKIEAMPTLMLFRQSKMVWEKIGETQEDEIKSAIGKL
jgi:thioredoxin 1